MKRINFQNPNISVTSFLNTLKMNDLYEETLIEPFNIKYFIFYNLFFLFSNKINYI